MLLVCAWLSARSALSALGELSLVRKPFNFKVLIISIVKSSWEKETLGADIKGA